jgi:predicted MFS family arabinose efflux permease
MRLVPRDAGPDAGILLGTRAARAFVDGLVSVVLPTYLVLLGLDGAHVGAIVTATLLGSAALVLLTGTRGHVIAPYTLLRVASLLMIATGLAFGVATTFWPLLVVGVIGTLNPSGGDVSVFLPTEQALLARAVPDTGRTALFARYSLVGFVLAALGALAAGLPELIARSSAISETTALRFTFAAYAAAGVLVLARYRHLSTPRRVPRGPRGPALGQSRRVVYKLAATFSLDSFGGGFVVQSLVALWLHRRFHISVATAGAVFFWSGLLSGFSALVAARIARRIGLIRTMVYTHLPANMLLMVTPLMPNVWLAVTCLLARAALSQMDVPARTSYVMAVVSPAERPAAASITNVPRSLAGALPPFAAGWMLDRSTFGWPLLLGGAIKATYDLVLLGLFRNVRPPEEQ